jgi:hypothetical protein
MRRYKDESPAVRVYTVSDESRFVFLVIPLFYLSIKMFSSINLICKNLFQFYIFKLCRYLIVRNVPALGCGNDLLQLFSTYGQVEE